MKTQQTAKKNGKLILLFFAILIGAITIGAFVVLRLTSAPAAAGELPPISADGYQEVHMSVNGLTYEPNNIPIRAGQKVRWTIDATRAQGCAHSMYSRSLGINQILQPGLNMIEFTPTKTGTILFSCSMGMARGQFQVI